MRLVMISATLAAMTVIAPTSFATVDEGDTAPMYRSVDEKMQAIDMADFIDGAPLVFLYGSAT